MIGLSCLWISVQSRSSKVHLALSDLSAPLWRPITEHAQQFKAVSDNHYQHILRIFHI